MLPAALLRRPGLGRLMRQARAYAEAAAAPAPAAGPGQMSFTFASPTQVRTLFGSQDPRPSPTQAGFEIPNSHSGSVFPNPQFAKPHYGPGIRVPQSRNSRTFHLESDAQEPYLPFKPALRFVAGTSPEIRAFCVLLP